VQDILKQYLASSTSEETLFNYLNSEVITLDERNREIPEVSPAFNSKYIFFIFFSNFPI
jgi:hypothetical protein